MCVLIDLYRNENVTDNLMQWCVCAARAARRGPVAVRGAARERQSRRGPDARAGADARPDLGRGALAGHRRPAAGRPADQRAQCHWSYSVLCVCARRMRLRSASASRTALRLCARRCSTRRCRNTGDRWRSGSSLSRSPRCSSSRRCSSPTRFHSPTNSATTHTSTWPSHSAYCAPLPHIHIYSYISVLHCTLCVAHLFAVYTANVKYEYMSIQVFACTSTCTEHSLYCTKNSI